MRRYRVTSVRQVAGLSLIELMIGMAIGLILVLGLVQIFSASRTASQLSEGAGRAQENARFALDFLQRDIRMAGHFGCVNDQAHFVKGEGDPRSNFAGVASGSGHPLDFSVSIQGYEAPGTAPGGTLALGGTSSAPAGLPTAIAGLNPRPGSDVLVLRYLHPEGVPVNSITSSGGGSVLGVDATRWTALTNGFVGSPTMFGIADCSHADVFAGTTAVGSVTSTGVVLDRYTPQPTGQTMVYRAESMVYYIATGASGEPALWRARANAAGAYPAALREELVEGIENLQLLYGLDSTATPSSATPPAGNVTVQNVATSVTTGTDAVAANQWRRVALVQVGILARSPAPAAAANPLQQARQRALGVEFTPPAAADGRYRATYEVTIALRNRLFGN